VPSELHGVRAEAAGGTIGISALTGDGVPELLNLLDTKLAAKSKIYEIDVPLADGAALSWLYAHGKMVDKRDTKTKSHIKIELDAADYGRYQSRFGK
jgi:GTP-binding protein HflX